MKIDELLNCIRFYPSMLLNFVSYPPSTAGLPHVRPFLRPRSYDSRTGANPLNVRSYTTSSHRFRSYFKLSNFLLNASFRRFN